MSYGFNQPEDKKDDKPLAQPPQILPDTVSKKSEEPEPTLKRKAPEEPPSKLCFLFFSNHYPSIIR